MDNEIEGSPASSHMSAHTSGRMSTQIEVVAGRRRWTVEQKLAILRDGFSPEGSVGDACKRHAIGSGSIYTWRRQAMSGELGGAIADVIEKIAGDWPATRWDELMPWNWQPSEQDVAQAA